jgi:hypothetical protein
LIEEKAKMEEELQKSREEMAVYKKQAELANQHKKMLEDSYDFQRYDVFYINDTKAFLKKGKASKV